mmetsp:Transcript_53094/g.113381  ORF Transcript_53094/g.113381 Transcript_53094/m.113381 type:complete len:767 (-) Transcript_53094:391-2691(-)|eukprot:CAMPEP_0206445056 /NCGR_PEP_ID=MMETSP0324_2-20121206/15270_1 /ASSEMBLY_ACC=CAM_ASM_000836 /TAXON_ID=2866 /ORGANISM="Crypthecodinium cohnii, Strain Seligo" /LENGTH=766 /DNA_ID=CAMNT_0053913177 /DNA_START=118 /DNA_END=2418 /DNA_ORIENTATION=+
MPITRNQQNKKKANRRPLTKDDKTEDKIAERLEANRKAKAQELKTEGNEAFAAGRWLDAIDLFTEAIEEDPSDKVFFSNRSAANLKLMRTADAVDDARQCVQLAPDWVKGHSRLGAALWADRQLQDAIDAFDAGLKLDPENEQMQQSRKDVLEELEKEKAEEEELKKQEEAKQAEKPEEKEPVIGIDLGTTYSAVAVWDVQAGGVRILADEAGNKTTPSYVAWSPDGERLIGHRAKAQAAREPKRTLFDVKRIIGSRAHEAAVVEEMKRLPYDINKLEDDRLEIRVPIGENGSSFAPEEISAMVLGKMKEIAEKDLGRPINKAVVTVPAYFNDAQRKATQAAGAIAGLEVLRIINEPTAAALGYGLDQKSGDSTASHVLVFDLGGGTFDVSVLHIEGGIVEVKATGGDTRLGGEDFDLCLTDYLVAEVKKKNYDVDDKVKAKAKRAAEAAKRSLSSNDSTDVELGEIVSGEEGTLTITRSLFEKLCAPFFGRTMDTVKNVLKDAKLQPIDIDDIVLVGGSTRVPCIQKMLQDHFGGKALCKSINPDEAVAYGAAVQGAILSNVRLSNSTELLLIDVTPLSLGIETEGKHHSIIIPRNTPVPCTKESTYTTTENYQEAIDVRVFEGERPCTDGNHLLGEFTVTGIERAKRGEAQVVVRFALDANGVLNVTALDKKTKAANSCRINNACKGLDAAEIKRMLNEAERMKGEDASYAEKLEVKSAIEEAAYSLEDSACDEVLNWLAAVNLSYTPKKELEKKLREIQKLTS